VIAAVTVASAGTGAGKDALPVSPWTMPVARLMSAGTFVGSLRATMLRCAAVVFELVVVVVMVVVVGSFSWDFGRGKRDAGSGESGVGVGK